MGTATGGQLRRGLQELEIVASFDLWPVDSHSLWEDWLNPKLEAHVDGEE